MSSLEKITSLTHIQPWITSFLLVLGCLSVAKVAIKTLVVLSQTFILPGANIQRFKSKQGSWAVVTGASDGIGKEFALQLAKHGFNIYLIARNPQLLSETASAITTSYPNVFTRTLSIDFAKNEDSVIDLLNDAFSGLDIAILVNNVGKSHNMPVYFSETPRSEMEDIVTINISATLRVTYTVLPGMIQRKRGLILNMGSFAGAVPSPMLATYSGTKAFLATFTAALAEEVRQHNILVEHLNTHFVVSKLSKIRKPSLLTPMPAAYVRSALSKVGLAGGAAFTGRPNTSTPYWSHSILDFVINLIGIPSLFISYTHNLHKDIRRRALRKLEREAKAH